MLKHLLEKKVTLILMTLKGWDKKAMKEDLHDHPEPHRVDRDRLRAQIVGIETAAIRTERRRLKRMEKR